MRAGALLNSSIGDYRLVDFIGAGGMGEVYRAIHSKLGRVVAIKVLRPESINETLVQRFQNEACIQARLNHSGISTLYDFSEINGQHCIIMEYVDGCTLAERIAAYGPLPAAEAVAVFKSVAEAIGHIHQHGIVHRDIKPNNIKINSAGTAKLLDFGIAKSLSGPGLTMAGDVVGTLQYLSPEQLKGGTADERSDIWALGVLLYEMVSGHVPFEAPTIGHLYEVVSKCEYLPASVLNPSVPKGIEEVISRCLRRNPGSRYQSVPELLQDIAALDYAGLSAGSAPALPSKRRARWGKWRWALAAPAVAVVLGVGSYFAITNWPSDNSDAPSGPVKPSPRAQASPAGKTNEESRAVLINVWEGTAEVYQDGKLVGTTPYELRAPLGEKVNLTLRRAGFEDYQTDFAVTENKKEYTFVLQVKPEQQMP